MIPGRLTLRQITTHDGESGLTIVASDAQGGVVAALGHHPEGGNDDATMVAARHG